MTQADSLLLGGWRALACLGYHTGLTTVADTRANGVLRYHSVGGGFYDNISPDRLRQEIAYLDREYDIVDLPAVLESPGTDRIALTFDDGYRDFYENVVPILHEFDVPATVFVITDGLDDPSFTHNDRYDYEYMRWEHVETLVDDPLVTIGNHTQSHPNLSELSAARLDREISGAKQRLESRLGTDIERFCYPFCQTDDRAMEAVRDSHAIGVAGRGRRESISEATDPATVPRVNGANPPWEVRWDLSALGTLVGSTCERLIDSGAHSSIERADDSVSDDRSVVDSPELPP